MYDFQVYWVQQQHEKVRRKRDYGTIYNGQFSPLDTASELDALLLGGVAPSASRLHTARYRALGVGTQSIFPDPLFKEEWYLVSAFDRFIH